MEKAGARGIYTVKDVIKQFKAAAGEKPLLMVTALAIALLMGIGTAWADGEIITTVAGGWIGDNGPATMAGLAMPQGVAVDASGNIYIADTRYNRIRKVAPSGVITTIAGTGASGYFGDNGPAASAGLTMPQGIAVDVSGNIYIADTNNHRIRKVDASGIITTVAGNGTAGFAGDNGPAVSASLNSPQGLAIDASGNIYFADSNNHRIRMVDTSGMIITVAGTGIRTYSGDGGPGISASLSSPGGVSVDASGAIYIADTGNHRIRMMHLAGVINTVAGNGIAAYSGDSGPAASANLSSPQGVFADASGNLYIADTGNNRVRMVAAGMINTVAGSGGRGYSGDGGPAVSANFKSPQGVAVDASGNIYIADALNGRIRKVDATGIVNTSAGGWLGDGGSATSATLGSARGVALDNFGNIYIVDATNSRIRKVDTSGAISTFAGNGIDGFSGDGGPANSASLNGPWSVAPDSSGNIYISDATNNRIRKVDATGMITTVAGNGTAGYSGDGGPATSASLRTPQGIAVDVAGNLYIADSANYRIRKVDASGMITTIAGNGTTMFSGDGGPAVSASLFSPRSVAVDRSGNIFIADTGHYRIRKVDTSGIITTVAGNGTNGYSGDGGPAVSASLYNPWGIFADASGNIYLTETGDSRIRKVDASGIITTVAGNGTAGYSGDGGPATSASLNAPSGVAVDAIGTVYIADSSNHRVRLVWNGQTVSLREVVVDSSGNPISGAFVMVVGNPSLSAYSDANGVFLLPVPQGVTFSHSISKPGYRTLYTTPRILTASSLTNRQRILYTDSEVAAWGVNPGFSAIRGRVLDSATSQTIYNAAVTAASTVNPGLTYTVMYDALCSTGTGTCYYTVINIAPNDPVMLTISAPGYVTAQVQANPLPADSVGSAITRLTKSVDSSAYLSTINGTWTTIEPTQTETVNISVFSGTSSYTASGAVSGQLTMTTSRFVRILTGTYAGWSYRAATYDVAGYHGSHYMVSDPSPNKSWGVFTGDLNGVYINNNGERKVYLTSIRGVRTSGVIDLVHVSTTNGTPTYYNNTTIQIRQNSKSATSTGYYNGTITSNDTIVEVNVTGDGFVLSSYQSDIGSGNSYHYAYTDNTQSPARAYRIGMLDGPLFGTRAIDFLVPPAIGSLFTGLMESVDPAYRPVTNYTWYRRDVQAQGNSLNEVAYGNNMYVAVGEVGEIFTSSDSVTWAQVASGTDNSLYGVAYGNNTFVAVGYAGTILVSSNGTNWSQIAANASTLNGITYAAGQFVAVGANGTIFTSANGTTWVARSSGTYDLNGVTYGGNMFMAVGEGGTALTSADASVWTTRSVGTDAALRNAAYGNGIFAATGEKKIYTSLDGGVTWTEITQTTTDQYGAPRPFQAIKGIAFANNIFVVVGNNYRYVSQDGMNWEEVRTGGGLLRGITYGSTMFIAVGTGDLITTSPEGRTWTVRRTDAGTILNGITYGNNRFVAAGQSGGVFSSTDGTVWTQATTGIAYHLQSIAYGNNMFVAVGRQGAVLSSTDGSNWSSTNLGTTVYLYGVAYGNNMFVAVGVSGRIYTSPDGTVWTAAVSPTANNLESAAFVNNIFLVAGDNGTILLSSDGVTWTAASSGTTSDLFSAAWGNNTYMVTGGDNTILRSPDGYTWTSVSSPVTPAVLFTVIYSGNSFVGGGTNGIIVTSPDGITWTRSLDELTDNRIRGIAYGNNSFVAVGDGHMILQSGSSGTAAYTITATAGAGGSISPSGSVAVLSGGSQTFTITPNQGYHVADVLVDGSSVGAVASYTFSSVVSFHTISAAFAADAYIVTASAGANGVISPSGAIAASSGSSVVFTVTPNAGYHPVMSGTCAGALSGTGPAYTFTTSPVTADCTVTASFEINAAHVVTPTVTAPQAYQFERMWPQLAQPWYFNPTGMAFDVSGNMYVADSMNERIRKFDASGAFLTEWGSFGTGDGQFDNPYAVAVDPSGNVYVAEYYSNRVQKFDANGAYQTKWGSFGSGNGQFSNPVGVAVDAAGNVYIADSSNNRIQKFDANGIYQTKWGSFGSGNGQFNEPRGVAIDPSGNVYVSDYGNDRVQKFDSSGAYITQWSSIGGFGQLNRPMGIAVDASGNVFVADWNYRVQKFDQAGTYLIHWGSAGTGDGQFNALHGVGVDGAGNVYVADPGLNRIQKFSPDGSYLAQYGSGGTGNGQFNRPWGVSAGSAGPVYVVDFLNNRVQKFDAAGAYLTQWGSAGSGSGQFNGPTGAAVDASGNVYIADMYNYRIQKFDPSGSFLMQWGSPGTGNGQFGYLWGVTVDGAGNIYVADSGNNRIQKFDPSGAYITQWGSYGTGNGQFNWPSQVAVDGSGHVYVADRGNSRIQKFDSNGAYLSQWGSEGTGDGQFRYPGGLTVDAAGNVFVADTDNARIQMFDPAGSYITQWGSLGSDSAQFTRLFGIAVDAAGNVYAGDLYNNRVQKFSFSAGSSPGGSIDPSTPQTVDYNGTTSFTLTPFPGYHIGSVTGCGGTLSGNIYTTGPITLDCAVSASFAANPSNIVTASAGENGSVAPTGSTLVNRYDDLTITIVPNNGYHVADVLVDGASVGAVNSYTFNNVTAPHTISATFALDTYTITVGAGPNGSIVPSGTLTVSHGGNAAFTITPDSGYHVADVMVDGVSVGVVSSYTFTNVTAPHTISAGFAINTYVITAATGTGGGVVCTPSTVDYGSGSSCTITPDTGYHIVDVMVDGISVGAPSSYPFTNVTADHSISAAFAVNTYIITAIAGPGGAIVCTPSIVNYGLGSSCAITPNAGYHVADVLVDGASAGVVASYTFTNVTGDHTIFATFAINTYTITATAGPGGSVVCNPAIVAYGSGSACTITPNIGHHITGLVVDGTPVAVVNSYLFTNVTSDHTITASFAINTYTISISKSGTGTGTVTSAPAGISCGADCSEVYDFGTSISLTAIADPDSVFTGWTGACSGTGPCTLTAGSDQTVSATFSRAIMITSPNGGENWVRGMTYTITWTYAGNPGAVNIELLQGGVLNRVVASGVAIGSNGTGSYNWFVPKNVWGGSDYAIRITSTSNSSYTDMSDASFSISK